MWGVGVGVLKKLGRGGAFGASRLNGAFGAWGFRGVPRPGALETPHPTQTTPRVLGGERICEMNENLARYVAPEL